MTASAIGRKNSSHARIHSVIDGAPARALREIHRRPTTATMFIVTMSHMPSTRLRCCTLLGRHHNRSPLSVTDEPGPGLSRTNTDQAVTDKQVTP